MASIGHQKTNLFGVGEAQELCFNYSPRTRRLWFTNPSLSCWTSLVSLRLVLVSQWKSNSLILSYCWNGIQLLKFLQVLLIYYGARKCTPQSTLQALSVLAYIRKKALKPREKLSILVLKWLSKGLKWLEMV